MDALQFEENQEFEELMTESTNFESSILDGSVADAEEENIEIDVGEDVTEEFHNFHQQFTNKSSPGFFQNDSKLGIWRFRSGDILPAALRSEIQSVVAYEENKAMFSKAEGRFREIDVVSVFAGVPSLSKEDKTLREVWCFPRGIGYFLADLVVCSRWVCEGGRVVISVPNYLLNHAEQHICFQDHVENFILTKMKLTIERVSRTGLREFHYNENKPRNCKEVVVSFTKLSSELMLYSQEIVAISLAPGRTHVSTNRAVSSDSSSASYRTIIHSNDQLFNLFQQLESGFKFRSQAENHLLAISAVFSAYFVQWVLQCVASKNQNQDSPQATTMASRDGERIQVLLTSVGKCLLQAIFPHFAILSAAESKKDSFTLQVYDSFKSIIGHECFPDVNTSNSANRARVRAKAVLDTISSFHWLTSACLVRLQKHDSSVIEVLQALIDDINTRPSTLKGLCETFGAQWGISTASLSSASSLQLKPPKQVHNASGSSRSSPKSFKQLLSAKASQDAQSDRNDLGSTTNANIQVEELRKTISQDSIVTSIPEPVASSSDKSLVSEDALISSLPAELAPLKTRNVRDYATSIDKETNFNVMGMTGISDMASQTLNEAAMAASAEIVDSSTETVSSSESEPANIVHSQETGSSRRRSSRLSLPAKTSSSSSAANKIGSRSKRSIELLKPITTTKDGRGNKKSRRSTINTESSDSQHLVALRSTLENTTGDTSTSSWLREWSLQALTSLASLEKKHGL